MYKQIRNAIWIVSLIVLALSLILIFGMSYRYFTGLQEKQLRTELELASKGIEISGVDYLADIAMDDYRLTWIEADGTVIFDNMAETQNMENHLERTEVKQAIETGYGTSSRYSKTLSEKQLYAAKKLSDGTVVRTSVSYATFWALMFAFGQAISAILIFVIIGSYAVALRISKNIVKPINNIDLDNPLGSGEMTGLEEIKPLLMRIEIQRNQHIRDNDEIEKASRIREEFTANVSHELKTPLHAISGYAELIVNGLTKEKDIVPFAGKIMEEAQRLTTLVEDIIELTKLDNGALDYCKEDVDLYRIAENTVDSLLTTAESRGIKIELEGEHAIISGIPKIIYSIVYNLVDNGIKYNQKNGLIKVSVFPSGGHAVLRVSDTGIGIPEDSIDRIFERFYVVDKSRSKEVGGTGLGLSIVKHGCIIHDAEMNVESETGKGSTFTITF